MVKVRGAVPSRVGAARSIRGVKSKLEYVIAPGRITAVHKRPTATRARIREIVAVEVVAPVGNAESALQLRPASVVAVGEIVFEQHGRAH